MSLSEEDVTMIVDAMKSVIVEPLRDVATSHQLAVQLIKDTFTRLEECKLKLESLNIDFSKANHRVIDVDTSIGIHRDLSKMYKGRISDLEIALEEKTREINDLRRQLNG